MSISEDKINIRINTGSHAYPLLTVFNSKRPKNTNPDDLTYSYVCTFPRYGC